MWSLLEVSDYCPGQRAGRLRINTGHNRTRASSAHPRAFTRLSSSQSRLWELKENLSVLQFLAQLLLRVSFISAYQSLVTDGKHQKTVFAVTIKHSSAAVVGPASRRLWVRIPHHRSSFDPLICVVLVQLCPNSCLNYTNNNCIILTLIV